MTISAIANVNFQTASAADAQAIVDAWTIPEGANVSLMVSEVLTQGTVDGDGNIVPPDQLGAPPPPSVAAEATS